MGKKLQTSRCSSLQGTKRELELLLLLREQELLLFLREQQLLLAGRMNSRCSCCLRGNGWRWRGKNRRCSNYRTVRL